MQYTAESFGRWMTEHDEFPKTYPAWSEYEGPRPSRNDQSNHEGEITCPTCHGQGFDVQEGNECRACGGDGKLTPTTTARSPEVARHQYPSTQTKVPFMGSLDLTAACPKCQGDETQVHESSRRGQALWRCAACGPLVNLDVHPDVNPFSPATTSRRVASATKVGSRRATARVMPMLASVRAANPGLTDAESLGLVLATVQRYPEEG